MRVCVCPPQGFPLSAILDHIQAATQKRLSPGVHSPTVLHVQDLVRFLTDPAEGVDGVKFGQPIAPLKPVRRTVPTPKTDGVVRIRVPRVLKPPKV